MHKNKHISIYIKHSTLIKGFYKVKIMIVEDTETLQLNDLLLFKTEEGQTLITQIKDLSIGEILLEIVGGKAEYLELEEIY